MYAPPPREASVEIIEADTVEEQARILATACLRRK